MSAYEFMCEVDFYILLNHTLVSDFSLNTQKVKILNFNWVQLVSSFIWTQILWEAARQFKNSQEISSAAGNDQ